MLPQAALLLTDPSPPARRLFVWPGPHRVDSRAPFLLLNATTLSKACYFSLHRIISLVYFKSSACGKRLLYPRFEALSVNDALAKRMFLQRLELVPFSVNLCQACSCSLAAFSHELQKGEVSYMISPGQLMSALIRMSGCVNALWHARVSSRNL